MQRKFVLWTLLGIVGVLSALYLPLLLSESSELSARHMFDDPHRLVKLGWPIGLLMAATLALGQRIQRRIELVGLILSVLVIPVAIVQAVHFWVQSGVALGVLLWMCTWGAAAGAKFIPDRFANRGSLVLGEVTGGAVGMVLGLIPMFFAACFAGWVLGRDCGM